MATKIPVVVEGVTTDSLMRDLSDISADVKKVTKALAESVGTDEGKENLKDTLENLARVTEALNQTVRENREVDSQHPGSRRQDHRKRRTRGAANPRERARVDCGHP